MRRQLDITMTATIRPEIVAITLQSFKEKLFDLYPCRLLLNVDPVGDNTKTQMDVVDVCYKYFKDIIFKLPDEPSLPKAFRWCWEQVMNEFVFHLEDDWELLQDVNIRDMMAFMDKTPNLVSLRLSAWKAEENRVRAVEGTTNPHKFIYYNFFDKFFEVGDWQKYQLGCSGHPGLWASSFIQEALRHLTTDRNPEKMLRYNRNIRRIADKYRFGVWIQPNENRQIRDLGEGWRTDNGLFKAGGANKAYFHYWSKDPDPYKELEED